MKINTKIMCSTISNHRDVDMEHRITNRHPDHDVEEFDCKIYWGAIIDQCDTSFNIEIFIDRFELSMSIYDIEMSKYFHIDEKVSRVDITSEWTVDMPHFKIEPSVEVIVDWAEIDFINKSIQIETS